MGMRNELTIAKLEMLSIGVLVLATNCCSSAAVPRSLCRRKSISMHFHLYAMVVMTDMRVKLVTNSAIYPIPAGFLLQIAYCIQKGRRGKSGC